MMTKIEFLECKRYLYLADNNVLNSSDKFVKMQSSFSAINEQCILNYKSTQQESFGKSMVPYFRKHGVKQQTHKVWI